ncbi:hypothetical protein [Paenibacillus hubeiensis]|uniref:hypothetical protein n=1 Tax=Paenibacillus hubeiensis TaxID=3077330 RepID=UPI0031B9F8AD
MMSANAYEHRYKELETTVYYDRKGTWRPGHLTRTIHTPGAEPKYILSLWFTPNLKVLPKVKYSGEMVYNVHYVEGIGLSRLKSWIKTAVGYVPEQTTVIGLLRYIEGLINAYRDEDSFYANQDQAAAAEVLNKLTQVAVQRLKVNEIIHENKHNRSQPMYITYLTDEEINWATEAQKVMNGHSYVEPFTSIGQQGHLYEFNNRLETIGRRWEEEQRAIQDEQLNEKLLNLLEVDVVLRRLVASALEVKKEKYNTDYEVELVHRLYGYTHRFEHYRSKLEPFYNLLESYGIQRHDSRKLLVVGERYVAAEGMLPPAGKTFEREEGTIYYGDRVHDGTSFFQVESVGHKYVYMRYGEKRLRRSVRHALKVMLLPDPKSLEEFLFNEKAQLHNGSIIPEAHSLDLGTLISKLNQVPNMSLLNLQKRLAKRKDQVSGHHKQAILVLLEGIELVQLRTRAQYVRGLAQVSHQDPAIFERLDELESKFRIYSSVT